MLVKALFFSPCPAPLLSTRALSSSCARERSSRRSPLPKHASLHLPHRPTPSDPRTHTCGSAEQRSSRLRCSAKGAVWMLSFERPYRDGLFPARFSRADRPPPFLLSNLRKSTHFSAVPVVAGFWRLTAEFHVDHRRLRDSPHIHPRPGQFAPRATSTRFELARTPRFCC